MYIYIYIYIIYIYICIHALILYILVSVYFGDGSESLPLEFGPGLRKIGTIPHALRSIGQTAAEDPIYDKGRKEDTRIALNFAKQFK